MQFKKGDVVELKSGGMKMTVSKVNEANADGDIMIACVWFDKGKQDGGLFDSSLLQTPSRPVVGVVRRK